MSQKPCKECPFRRASGAGYLGDSSPERFIFATMLDEKMPCHCTINYEDPNWKERFEAGEIGKECAGAATFFANLCKVSRDKTRLRLAPSDEVFKTPSEFVAHHRSGARSWDGAEEEAIDELAFPMQLFGIPDGRDQRAKTSAPISERGEDHRPAQPNHSTSRRREVGRHERVRGGPGRRRRRTA